MSIILKNVCKQFGPALVVNNVSLEIQDGELFVMLGASGSGKSTLLRIIAGLLMPDGGSVKIGGLDVTNLDARKRNVGMVFQNYSLFGHMTVFENVEFGLHVRKMPQSECRLRSRELLEAVGLTGLGDRYPDQLSGGQQQRVAVARALAYNPNVLLMDEPFGALDVKIRATLRQNLKEIQRQLKVTTMLVTHDQEEAFELADRIGVIERGRLIETGPPERLYYHPQTEHVATFIGGGNVLVGQEIGGKIRLGSVILPFPERSPNHAPGSPVRILFRPETVTVQVEPFNSEDAMHVLGRGKVVKRIFNGAVQRFVLEMDQFKGVRPLVPAPGYGQPQTRIEVVLTNQGMHRRVELDDRFWVGIRDYHVLQPSGIRFLVLCQDSEGLSPAVKLSLELGSRSKGVLDLFSVVRNESEVKHRKQDLDQVVQGWQEKIPNLTSSVVSGDLMEMLTLRIQVGHYDLLVTDRKVWAGEPKVGFVSILEGHHTQLRLPVLIAGLNHKPVANMLICTAAGEPGKRDIQFGGRIALRIGADVTVLSAIANQAALAEEQRVTRYMDHARQSLNALGIVCDTLIRSGDPVQEVLMETRNPKYDLIVIGAPLPKRDRNEHWSNLTESLLADQSKSVLIVPLVG